MYEQVSIYFSRGYSSLKFRQANGVTRDISAKDMKSVIHSITDDTDREVLARLCKAILECVEGNCKRIEEF